MDRGCRDISGGIRPLDGGSRGERRGGLQTTSYPGAGVDGAFPHAVYTGGQCSKNTPKTATFSHFSGPPGAAAAGGSLGKSLQHQEIGHDLCSAGPFKTEWVRCTEMPYRFPLIVHYPRPLTMAPDPRSLAFRERTGFQRLNAEFSLSGHPASSRR